ncbi:MAG TPA: HD domain-containing phosphohydrolase [Gemmatimonadaceae bacterium]|nr:HD domain-containing phosphohydrolase [Gemmatimonadaceae bacterium]
MRQPSRTVQAAARPSVLCVDDELPVLDGIARMLSSRFNVTKVTNGADAIVALQYGGPFAVVVSDFCLAETDGAHLLAQVREIAPDTVRLLLTGRAAMDDAIAAINEGNIFGFIRKPCRPDMLIQRVSDAVAHHRLLASERELREQTLSGSIKALTDLLALTCPVGSGRATRLKRYACDLAAALRVDPWEIEIAAMVSQVGCLTLAPDLVERLGRGAQLTAQEQATVDRLPLIAEGILATIPRLEGVREILRRQQDAFEVRPRGAPADDVPIGARILRVASDFDALYSKGTTVDDAVSSLSATTGTYDPDVVAALAAASSFFGRDLDTIEISLSEVEIGMVFVRELRSPAGMLLIARGQDVTPSLLERVRNHWSTFAARERVRVVRHARRAH